ncbi:MAG TPA: hypothetical protein VGQ09_00940 [Chitinophagaceae bacterium]|jgi:Flp pilus assembly protein TadB|nr:hypothetical protein [Chitinophagaceae bacterium]
MALVFILILLAVVLVLTNYMWRKDEDRKEKAHEKKKEQFERLMEILRSKNSEKNTGVSDMKTDKNSES